MWENVLSILKAIMQHPAVQVTFLVVAVLIHRILGGTGTKSSKRPEVEQPV